MYTIHLHIQTTIKTPCIRLKIVLFGSKLLLHARTSIIFTRTSPDVTLLNLFRYEVMNLKYVILVFRKQGISEHTHTHTVPPCSLNLMSTVAQLICGWVIKYFQ